MQLMVQLLSVWQLVGQEPPRQFTVHTAPGAQVGVKRPLPRWFMVHMLSAAQRELPSWPSLLSVHMLRGPQASLQRSPMQLAVQVESAPQLRSQPSPMQFSVHSPPGSHVHGWPGRQV